MKKGTTTIAAKADTKKTVVKKKAAVKKVAAVRSTSTPKSKSVVPTIVRKNATTVRPHVVAHHGKSFWTNDGQILNNLTALAESFATMDTILFKYHVQKEQNDFADWVEQVLEDEMCAAALRKAKTPKSAHTVILKHLRYYA